MRNGFLTPLTVLFSLATLLANLGCASTPRRYDMIVYGGTAGGVISAIAAANEGASVAILEPGKHIGGMVTGGLGATDYGNQKVIGGMSREFFVRLGKHYGQNISWYFEPHVAEKVLNDWLSEAHVPVFYEHRLRGVERDGNRITRITMDNGTRWKARLFIDTSYEGDLMALAKVRYTWGREGQAQYGESLAGVREWCKYHQFEAPVTARDEAGKLLPCVYDGPRGDVGQADRKVQAYNFRLCLCNRKENQVPFPKPAQYDPARYEILKRYLAIKGQDLKLGQIMSIIMMPNGKTDINNNGAFSSDHIGGSWEYPEASNQRRREIWNDHVNYVQGWLYFLANDPSVPKHIQDEMNTWGLAADEFVDNNHWPYQLYIREARRMVGEYVMIQKDLQTERTKSDSIGMGSYNSDSHHVQRIEKPDGTLENEGDMQVGVKPYEIAYRMLLPLRSECTNLFVGSCFSASHVAYSSLRMEPQYMIIGQAAGVAGAYAVKHDCSVQDVDVAWLQKRLCEQKAILTPADISGGL